MGKRLGGRIGAALLLAYCAVVAVPACVIRIGPGDGSDGSDITGTDPGQTEPGEHHDPETEITPEEEAAAVEALANADPMEVEIANYKAQYAAYALAGLVETTAGDPEAVDEAQLQKIIDAHFPQVWDEASLWVSSLDPSLIVPQAKVFPATECYEDPKYGCDYTEKCTLNGKSTICLITGCGVNGCSKVPCPDLFPELSKLFVKSWCTFTCVDGSTVVGVKVVFNVLLNGRIWRCVPLEKPVP